MENKDLITVVVPVYNVETFLDECVASLVKQTCRDLEILLVDDGSTDGSGKMCDLWAEKDPRIRALHKENGGLSDARNAGLREAKGKYVAFVDADDVLAPAFLECLYTQIRKSGAGISCCGYVRYEDGGKPGFGVFQDAETETMDAKEFLRVLHRGRFEQVGIVATNKLYALDIFRDHGIEYPKGKVHEDTFTTCRLLYYAGKVSVTECPLYGYRQRGGSIMRSKVTVSRCINGIEADYSNVAFFKEQQERELTQLVLNAFFKSTIQSYKKVSAKDGCEDPARCRRLLVTAFRQVWRQDRQWYQFGLVKRIAYRLFYLFPKAAARLIP